MGTCGQDIPFETQFLIVEGQGGGSELREGGEENSGYMVFFASFGRRF